MPKLPALDDLHLLLICDAEAGVLTWKTRPDSFFVRAGMAQSWNRRFENKPALNTLGNHGYFYGHLCCQKFLAHRIIWVMTFGFWPDEVDHINGDRSDNRIQNLRNVSHQGNACNRALQRNNTSGAVGVFWNDKVAAWQARIQRNGRVYHLGFHQTFDTAVLARKAAAVAHNFHINHGRKPCAKISSY